MSKLLPFTYIVLFFAFKSLTAQNYPYLNSSTGNKGDFIVDADSNIIMFHNTRIEKLDKDFNPIWVNSYSGLRFTNLLLSKTGSLFFIAQYASTVGVGKIDATGNLAWCKTLPSYTLSGNSQVYSIGRADQLLLDRNNELIITGTSFTSLYFLKLDTLGGFIKLRLVTNNVLINPYHSHIINDVSGVYHVSSWGYGFEGPVYNLTHQYDDPGNTITADSAYEIAYMGMTGQNPSSNEQIFKSKMQSDAFYICNNAGAFSSTLNNTFSFRKIKNSSIQWGIHFQTSSPYVMSLESIEEDLLKNVFLSVLCKNINTNKYDKWIVKIDSNGVSDNKKYNYLQNYGKATLANPDSVTQLKHHYGNNFFYSVETSGLLPGPLSIIKMDSTVGSYCTPAASIAVSPGAGYQYQPGSVGQSSLTSVQSVTMQTVSSVAVSPVPGYSVITSSCLALTTRELDHANTIAIYPNPATNALNISAFESPGITQTTVFDLSGKQVLSGTDSQSIDVSKLKPGLYFLKLKTSQGEFSRKFMKE